MKTQNTSKKNVLLLFLLICFAKPIFAQIPCTYPVTNNTPCTIDVTFEYIDGTCNSICPAPVTVSCPGGGIVTNLGPAACCAGAVEIVMNITSFNGTPVSTPLISVYGGCSGTIPVSDSGNTPSTGTCYGGTATPYTFAATATGATIN